MKKHLFLLGSFMATSLVTANTLLVISCQKKAKSTKNDGKDDEKSTETVINQKSNELKDKIRNIIDEIITNTNQGDWMIDLQREYQNNYKDIISKLKAAVDILRSKTKEKDQQMLLADVSELDQDFITKINDKFASLKNLIMSKISESDIIDVSNLEFDLVSDSILPILTKLNGKQVIEAIAVLKSQKSITSFSSNSMTKNLGYAATNEDNFDLFKVKTNLKYNFKIAGKLFEGDYNDVELLLTGDIDTFKNKKQYTQETIAEILTEYKDVKIYGADDGKDWLLAQESGYLGKKMDWDFSKIAVKNEIANLQFEQFKALKGYDEVIKANLEVKSENIDFDIDSSHYMKFDNHDMDLKRSGEDNILVKQNTTSMKSAKEAVTTLNKQFFSDNDSAVEKWNGGKINRKFIEQLKIDSSGTNPRINLDKYYGLGEKPDDDKYNSFKRKMLIGYGTTTVRGAKYAGIQLASININTDITASFNPGMEAIYHNLEKYVETIVKSLEGDMRIGKLDGNNYFFEWQFPNKGEWEVIMKELARPESDATVTFDWVMENVLKKIRILGEEGKEKYRFPVDNISKEAWSFLKTVNEIKYIQRDNDNALETKNGYSITKAALYVKYEPFVVHLVGDDVLTNLEGWRTRGIIAKIF